MRGVSSGAAHPGAQSVSHLCWPHHLQLRNVSIHVYNSSVPLYGRCHFHLPDMSLRYCYWPCILVGKMRLLVPFMHISEGTGPFQGHFKIIHRWGPQESPICLLLS